MAPSEGKAINPSRLKPQASSLPASRHLLYWPLAAAGLALDLWSKHYMFSQPDLRAGQVRWVWTGHAGFQLSLNEGALFGMGQGGVWLFAACSTAAALAIPTWLFWLGGARDWRVTAVLGAVTAGVLGNLYDRCGLPGLDWGLLRPERAGERVYAVRDFVLLVWQWPPTKWWHVWPNFNVADALLVCGLLTLALMMRSSPNDESAGATRDQLDGPANKC